MEIFMVLGLIISFIWFVGSAREERAYEVGASVLCFVMCISVLIFYGYTDAPYEKVDESVVRVLKMHNGDGGAINIEFPGYVILEKHKSHVSGSVASHYKYIVKFPEGIKWSTNPNPEISIKTGRETLSE